MRTTLAFNVLSTASPVDARDKNNVAKTLLQRLDVQKQSPEVIYKKAVHKNFVIQYSQENTCVGVSF